jgi:hypothetical protein
MGIMKVIGLMQEAREIALYRGHKVKNWNVLGNECYSLECSDCKMTCMVKENPLPNEIDLGGEILALNCVKPEKKKGVKKI